MADFKLEDWEHEPLWLKLITPYLKKKRFPELVETPEYGKWYRIYPEGCVAADGERTHAVFQLGTENKLVVFFQGGGVSWNEYTAARPVSLYSKNAKEGFYMIHVDLFADLNINKGIFEDRERNPFKNWSKLILSYNTGDFHVGQGDFTYTALDGRQRNLHHHGYKNYRKVMETVTGLVNAPDGLLICGCSGGGFGAALLADDLIGLYPDCSNVVTLVDSGFFLLEGWREIAKNVWHAPEAIVSNIRSDNITLDALLALHRKHGEKVKILFSCSHRDGSLARMENYITTNQLTFTQASGSLFHSHLQAMCAALREQIPSVGLYVFDKPDPQQKKLELSVHCMIADSTVHEYPMENVTGAKWIHQAFEGKIMQIGLHLLNKKKEKGL